MKYVIDNAKKEAELQNSFFDGTIPTKSINIKPKEPNYLDTSTDIPGVRDSALRPEELCDVIPSLVKKLASPQDVEDVIQAILNGTDNRKEYNGVEIKPNHSKSIFSLISKEIVNSLLKGVFKKYYDQK